MKKQEKIDLYMSKGLTKEQAQNLLAYCNDDALTVEELRIKYDNSNLGSGKYPDWITYEEHIKICYKTVKDIYTHKNYGWFTTPQDLANDLYLWSLIRLSKFKSPQELKVGLLNRCKNIVRDEISRSKYWVDNLLDKPLSDDDEDSETVLSRYIACKNNELEEIETIQTIKSIKNREIRNLLIICGYLIADFTSLEDDYNNVINDLKPSTYKKFCKLTEQIKDTEHKKMKPIQFKDIIKVLGFKNIDSNFRNTTEAIRDIQDYLINCNFVQDLKL